MKEIIDIARKGNVLRLYLGKNGKQWGDDWDDTPYEHNCEIVYPEFVEATKDINIPFNIEIIEPADMSMNSSFSREDFMKRKIYALEFFFKKQSLGTIHFGDTLKDVIKIIEALKN